MSDYITMITNDNFEQEVLKSEKPVVCDFYATWCGPCKMMAPVFEEAAEKLNDVLKFCKIDIDEAGLPAVEYKVMSVPTLIIFKDGNEYKRSVGMLGEKEFDEFVSEVLN